MVISYKFNSCNFFISKLKLNLNLDMCKRWKKSSTEEKQVPQECLDIQEQAAETCMHVESFIYTIFWSGNQYGFFQQ